MSEKIRRILVAIRDPKRVPAAQLRKAATIARASGASVELFHAITEPETVGVTDQEPAEHIITKRLRQLERSTVFQDLQVRSCTLRDYPTHEAIVRRAIGIRADLVIAAPQPRTFGARLLLRNTDWELIRHCPCPLLLVKSKGRYDKPVILTAVDPFHAHATPANLDPQLLSVGNSWASLLEGQSHAFHAFLPLAVAVPMPSGQPMAGWLAPEIEELHSSQVQRAFQSLTTDAGIDADKRHLSVGDVPTELNRVIKKTDADIVIMGALSRAALKRLLIGSTAERVLDDLTCDALIVKPPTLATRSSRQKASRPLRAA